MAIQQQQMYKQVQALNANLERRVQEQTAELEQSLKFYIFTNYTILTLKVKFAQ